MTIKKEPFVNTAYSLEVGNLLVVVDILLRQSRLIILLLLHHRPHCVPVLEFGVQRNRRRGVSLRGFSGRNLLRGFNHVLNAV